MPHEYVKVSKTGLKPGMALAVNLFVHLPLNDKVVLFKAAGAELSASDCENLKAVAEGCLVALKAEVASAKMKAAAAQIRENIPAEGGPLPEQVQREAERSFGA
jgi:hypothetical protein